NGIRDLYVTGVQTCALPICHLYYIFSVVNLHRSTDVVQRGLSQSPRGIFWKASAGSDSHTYHPVVYLCYSNLCLAGTQLHAVLRSEERRVGKECGVRGSRGG